MKKIKFEDLEKLENISVKLERIPKDKSNKIIDDMRWLCQKLRETILLVEEG